MKKAILNLSQVVGILLMALPLSGGCCAHGRRWGSAPTVLSPYELAKRGKDPECFKHWFDNLKDAGYLNYLWVAVEGGNKEIVQHILSNADSKQLRRYSALDQSISGKKKYSALGVAVIKGDKGILEELLNCNGLDILKVADNKASKPIQLAAKYKRNDIFDTLLNKIKQKFNNNSSLRSYLMQTITKKGKTVNLLDIAAQPTAKYTCNLGTKFDRNVLSPEKMVIKVLDSLKEIITPKDFRRFQGRLLHNPKRNAKILKITSRYHETYFTGKE